MYVFSMSYKYRMVSNYDEALNLQHTNNNDGQA